jgi:hypothetical protein
MNYDAALLICVTVILLVSRSRPRSGSGKWSLPDVRVRLIIALTFLCTAITEAYVQSSSFVKYGDNFLGYNNDVVSMVNAPNLASGAGYFAADDSCTSFLDLDIFPSL